MTRDRSVSVVMIFWNAATFMDEAVRSVVSQTHEEVELLLCDDGSTDASTAMAQDWAARLPTRIRYVQHEGHAHRGMSATRNLGIRNAVGDLLAFLDADDVWEPQHLALQVACLSAHPEAAVVCGPALDWHSWDVASTSTDAWSPLPWPGGTVVAPPRMLTAVLRQGSYSTPVCSLLVPRSVVSELGGSEDRFTGMYEDQALLSKIYLSRSIVISEARTALYRQHAGSSTAQAIRIGLYHPMVANRSREAFLRWLQGQLQLHGDAVDPELRSALDAAMAPYKRPSSRLRWRVAAFGRRVRRDIRGRAGASYRRLFATGQPADREGEAQDEQSL